MDDPDMALPLARPDHVRVRLRLIDPQPAAPRSAVGGAVAHIVVGAVVRGLVVGLGLGLLIVAGSGAVSLTVAGILALGAAMASSDP